MTTPLALLGIGATGAALLDMAALLVAPRDLDTAGYLVLVSFLWTGCFSVAAVGSLL